MKILEVFDKGRTDHSLKPLDPTELTDLEALFHEKNSRLYFRCPVRRKDILAKPEEAVRQLWILRLTNQYGYPLTRLAVEYPITFGRDTSKRADIVVFDADRPTVPFTIVEVKRVKFKDGNAPATANSPVQGAYRRHHREQAAMARELDDPARDARRWSPCGPAAAPPGAGGTVRREHR